MRITWILVIMTLMACTDIGQTKQEIFDRLDYETQEIIEELESIADKMSANMCYYVITNNHMIYICPDFTRAYDLDEGEEI